MTRKPAKRETKPRHGRLPGVLYLSGPDFDQLRRLVQWYEQTPDYIDLGEHTEDYIYDCMATPFEAQLPEDAYVTSVEIETRPRKKSFTSDQLLIAIVEDEFSERNVTEHRIPVRVRP